MDAWGRAQESIAKINLIRARKETKPAKRGTPATGSGTAKEETVRNEKILFAIGLLLADLTTVLLLMNATESRVAAVIGTLESGLFAPSGRSNLKRIH